MSEPADEPVTATDDEAAFLDEAINRAIGRRLHEERRRLGLTLNDVATRSGLSLGMISKIENAQTSPSLRTLARLSLALEVPVTTFFRGFEEERDASYVKAGEGIELVRQGTRHGHRYELLAAAKGAQRRVQPFLVTLTKQSEEFPLFQHDGVEFLYGLEGSFVYRYGQHTYDLGPGDSLMFDGHIPHGPERLDALPIRFLSITVELDADEGSG
ncbi:MAG TPA: XRE family transcriptional regulator [Candidatus Limnocylindrales bacterium]|nr:XRE family transcriptional regulator [Candidatus Limnocylindrales bacterium]